MSDTPETLSKLISAANAVVDRWETPTWKEAKPTASYIHALRDAVKAMECEDHNNTYVDALRRIYDISSDRRRSGKENELTWPDSVQISVIARNALETL